MNWLFDLGAPLYALGTDQVIWRESAATLTHYFPPWSGPHILDLGIGPATAALAMQHARPDARIVGLDIASGMLAQARRRLREVQRARGLPHLPVVVQADAVALPFPAATFDVVTGHSFLYLLPDAVAVLREARRVLVPGGVALFLEPHRAAADLRSLATVARHLRYLATMAGWRLVSGWHGRYEPERFERETQAAGLVPLETRPVLHNLGLLCVAGRVAPRQVTGLDSLEEV